ncbi:MAG: polysaccharide biosynthesis/export family protein [Candidatus Aegiribacteria sp.]|nr:polysaccharide biosynthesis/export family protein [Candidatus Aegiribacteria sp.]
MLLTILMILIQSVSPPVSGASGISISILEQADRNSYVLGPGDVVTIVIEGGCTEALLGAGVLPLVSCRIGSDGYLSVSGIGAVDVDGLTIEQAQYTLQRTVTRFYPSLEITLSLSEPRMLRASIRGMVNEPGTYIMTSLNRVSDLVKEAGCISVYGSRIGKLYTSTGDTLEVDLHISSETGFQVADPFLTNNASVVFDVCTNPVFLLRSDLIYPATPNEIPERIHSFETWELAPYDNFESLVVRMGGLPGNVNLSETRIVRNSGHFPVWADSVGILQQLILPGDTILLVLMSDSITVAGAVNSIGSVVYRPESTVLDYIVAAGGLSNEAGSDISIFRNGKEYETNEPAEGLTLLPGDGINVGYNWFSRNRDLISVFGTIVSIGVTVYAISK